MPEFPGWGELSGLVTVAADGSKATEPQGFGGPFFVVASGPCVAYGRCVGRPEGYEKNEACAITVGGGGGVLGPCPVFDIESTYRGTDHDHVTLPGEALHQGSDCPEGAALVPGDAIAWTSDGGNQGNYASYDNGCAAKGTCGLPYSLRGLGGGWELCFV